MFYRKIQFVKVNLYSEKLSLCVGEKRLFGFCLSGWLLRWGQKPMCRLWAGKKIELKKMRVGKIKNTEG